MGRVKAAFSCDWQEVNHAFRSVFSCFFMFLCCPWRSINSIVILNFHWDLLYIVDISECEKGSFWEVSVPKTSAAAIFSGDLYIFAKYAPVFSNRAFPTTFASHRHCHVRTYVQMRSFNFCSFSGQDVTTDREHWLWKDHTPARVDGASMNPENVFPARERYYPTPPHPCVTWHIFNVAWRMCARASERAVA